MEKLFLFYLALLGATCKLIVTKSSSSEGKLTFVATGDFGGLPYPPYVTNTQKNLARVMASRLSQSFGTRFILGLGDNFYFNGVKNVKDKRFAKTFEAAYSEPVLRAAKWYMIAGNHDHEGNVSAQIAYSKRSTRWHFPDLFYSVVEKIPGTSSTVHLVMIDTTLLCFKRKRYPQLEQLEWIRETLQSSTADYLLVAGHHPVLSAGQHGSTFCLLKKLKKLLERYNVTAYLCGHDHNLQHIKTHHTRVHYIVTGNGNFYNAFSGNRIRLPEEGRSLKYFYGSSGAVTLLEATKERLQLTMINENDREMNRIVLTPRTLVNSNDQATSQSVLDEFFNLQMLYNTSTDDYNL